MHVLWLYKPPAPHFFTLLGSILTGQFWAGENGHGARRETLGVGDVGGPGGEGQRDSKTSGMRWRGRKTRTPPKHTPARPHVCHILNWELTLVSDFTSVCPRRWPRESQGALIWVCYSRGRSPTLRRTL